MKVDINEWLDITEQTTYLGIASSGNSRVQE